MPTMSFALRQHAAARRGGGYRIDAARGAFMETMITRAQQKYAEPLVVVTGGFHSALLHDPS